MEIKKSFSMKIFEDPKKAENFICGICLNVVNPEIAIEHISCGRLFCKVCTDSWASTSNGSKCPCCSVESFKTDKRNVKTENKLVSSMLLSLRLMCPSNEEEKETVCTWKGEMLNLKSHQDICPETQILCDLNCLEVIKRKDLPTHKASSCPHRPIECKFCKVVFKLSMLDSHYLNCDKNPEKIIECEYQYIGCNFMGNKLAQADHALKCKEDHLILYKTKFSKKNIEEMENKIKKNKKNSYNPHEKYCRSCPHGHTLKKNSTGLTIICNMCGCTSQSTLNYQCRSCDYDICYKCYHYSPIPLKCPRNSHHFMQFSQRISSGDRCYECHNAAIKYKYKYFCSICDISICKLCKRNKCEDNE